MKDSPLKITRWFLSFLTNTENHRAGNCRLWLTSKGWHEQSVQFTRSPSWQRDKQISNLQVQWRFCCPLKLFSSSFLLSVQLNRTMNMTPSFFVGCCARSVNSKTHKVSKWPFPVIWWRHRTAVWSLFNCARNHSLILPRMPALPMTTVK